MARVTVEDCITKIPNRFELVLVAGQRARDISAGMELTVDRDNDKNPVVALREIADETLSIEELQMALVTGLQKFVEVQEPEEEEMEILAAERELAELDEIFAEALNEINASEEEAKEETKETADAEPSFEDVVEEDLKEEI